MSERRKSVAEQLFGHNKPPVEEVLKADFADLIKEVDAFIGDAGKAPKKIKTPDDLTKLGLCITDLRSMTKRVEGIRQEEGKPLFDAKKQVDAFFNDLATKLSEAAKTLQNRADDYTRAKVAEEKARREAEAKKAQEKADAEAAKADEGNARAAGNAEKYAAQAETAAKRATSSNADLARTKQSGVTASARTSWDFRIDDYPKVQTSLGPLGPFLARADVEKAIRSVVRIQKGNTALPGVAVFENVQSTFRR